MKKILIFLLIAIICISFFGCGKRYETNIKASEIAESLKRSIVTDGGYRAPSESFMTINLGIPEHYMKDFEIIVAKDDVNQNEIGVFRAESRSDAKEIAKYCQKYIDNVQANYNPDYDPFEATKVDNATVHIFGVYVIYTILTPEDTDYALIVIDNLISIGI